MISTTKVVNGMASIRYGQIGGAMSANRNIEGIVNAQNIENVAITYVLTLQDPTSLSDSDSAELILLNLSCVTRTQSALHVMMWILP